MNTKLIALATALSASLALASAAEAGDGVRLNFGGPLGTFVAKPAHGGGSHDKQHSSRKHAPVIEASRPAQSTSKSKSKVVKAEAAKETAPKVETATTDTSGDAPRVTGSSALIQATIPAEDTESTVEVPADATTGPAPDVKAEATAAEETESSVTASADQAQSGSETKSGPQTCKKFIPAIGTTVSVGCNE